MALACCERYPLRERARAHVRAAKPRDAEFRSRLLRGRCRRGDHQFNKQDRRAAIRCQCAVADVNSDAYLH